MHDASSLGSGDFKPRLWVETVWLLESLTVDAPLREISLRRGLNLIVSPPRIGSPGHGVGKTAFCQLLRFVLEDPLWTEGSTLRDELLQNKELRDGGVAAQVHLGDEVWTIVKPWQYQKHYRASRTATWQQLAAGEAENEFGVYQAALRRHLVEILPVQSLPGSKQSIEWHQILAWCSRDQNARYQSYFQWRAEGAGFSSPVKDPLALMQIVLGLLSDTNTLVELEKSTKSIEDQKAKLQKLREEPERLMKHVRRQLNRRLETTDAVPFRREGLFDHPNLIDIAHQRRDAYRQDLHSIDGERRRLSAERQAWVEKGAPLKAAIDLITNEIAQRDAIVSGDLKRVQELQSEASSLRQRLPTMCDAGNRLLRDCQYVLDRIEQTQLDRKQRMVRHQRSQEEQQREAATYRKRLEELRSEITPIEMQLSKIDGESAELNTRHAQVLSDSQLLSDAIEDYEDYDDVSSGRTQWEAIEEAARKLDTAEQQRDLLRTRSELERQATSGRRRALTEAMQMVAIALPSFTWGVFNDDEKHRMRPFQMGPMHSTTFGVLEILAGDIACLLDSASEQSFHPGLLLHDSPREAEMSEALFWALLRIVATRTAAPLQYIVTTSTQPSEEFNPFVRLELASDDDHGLLFLKRIGIHQAPLP